MVDVGAMVVVIEGSAPGLTVPTCEPCSLLQPAAANNIHRQNMTFDPVNLFFPILRFLSGLYIGHSIVPNICAIGESGGRINVLSCPCIITLAASKARTKV